MSTIVVFSEEPSAAIVVRELASRVASERDVRVVEHQGKSDLRDSFPRKIRAWVHPPDTRFVVLMDNDGADCRKLKSALFERIPPARRSRARVRLIIHELESWYLGDLPALQKAGFIAQAGLQALKGRAKFRNPDALTNAKDEFLRLVEQKGQRLLARAIAPHLDVDGNRSGSFKLFVDTLRRDW